MTDYLLVSKKKHLEECTHCLVSGQLTSLHWSLSVYKWQVNMFSLPSIDPTEAQLCEGSLCADLVIALPLDTCCISYPLACSAELKSTYDVIKQQGEEWMSTSLILRDVPQKCKERRLAHPCPEKLLSRLTGDGIRTSANVLWTSSQSWQRRLLNVYLLHFKNDSVSVSTITVKARSGNVFSNDNICESTIVIPKQ